MALDSFNPLFVIRKLYKFKKNINFRISKTLENDEYKHLKPA